MNYRWWTSYRCKGRCNVNVDKHKLFSPKTRWLTHVLQSLVYIYILFTSTSIVKQCTQFNVSSGSCLIKNMSPASNDVFVGITVIQYTALKYVMEIIEDSRVIVYTLQIHWNKIVVEDKNLLDVLTNTRCDSVNATLLTAHEVF